MQYYIIYNILYYIQYIILYTILYTILYNTILYTILYVCTIYIIYNISIVFIGLGFIKCCSDFPRKKLYNPKFTVQILLCKVGNKTMD